VAELHWAAALLALAEHRHWDASVRLRQGGSHAVISAWGIADLTAAAVRTGKVAEVTGILTSLEGDNEMYDSPHLTMLLQRSRALLADGPAAEAAYQGAIDAGHGSGAPLELARTQLAYGVWLRRPAQELQIAPPRRGRLHQPGDRRPGLPVPPDRRQPPLPGLPEAGSHLRAQLRDALGR